MKLLLLCLSLLVCVSHASTPSLFLVGDSTMCNYPSDPPNPQMGWGQALPRYFKSELKIRNFAVGGQSTLSFIAENRWHSVLSQIETGDFIVIQFGHNDQKYKDPTRYAPADSVYRQNLIKLVSETRAKGASPIIATSVVRRYWKGDHYIDSLGEYPKVAREVAATTQTPLLELHDLTQSLVIAHGPEGSKRLYLWVPPGLYVRNPKGWRDDSHFSAYGADRVAALAVQELIRLNHPLTQWLNSETSP